MTQITYNGFFSQYNYEELLSIIDFLKAVKRRTESGIGVGIDKKTLRDLFFNTPESFKKEFEEKPNKELWRGQDYYPCEYEDGDDFYLQSFSNKSTASFFGDKIFSSEAILKYGGSFSTKKIYENKKIDYNDWLWLESQSFYFYNESKGNKNYSKHFTREEFYYLYSKIKEYENVYEIDDSEKEEIENLLDDLKGKGINFSTDQWESDYNLDIADDESEVMFFDVEYDCELIDRQKNLNEVRKVVRNILTDTLK